MWERVRSRASMCALEKGLERGREGTEASTGAAALLRLGFTQGMLLARGAAGWKNLLRSCSVMECTPCTTLATKVSVTQESSAMVTLQSASARRQGQRRGSRKKTIMV